MELLLIVLVLGLLGLIFVSLKVSLDHKCLSAEIQFGTGAKAKFFRGLRVIVSKISKLLDFLMTAMFAAICDYDDDYGYRRSTEFHFHAA